jgi:hypothetical protein
MFGHSGMGFSRFRAPHSHRHSAEKRCGKRMLGFILDSEAEAQYVEPLCPHDGKQERAARAAA